MPTSKILPPPAAAVWLSALTAVSGAGISAGMQHIHLYSVAHHLDPDLCLFPLLPSQGRHRRPKSLEMPLWSHTWAGSITGVWDNPWKTFSSASLLKSTQPTTAASLFLTHCCHSAEVAGTQLLSLSSLCHRPPATKDLPPTPRDSLENHPRAPLLFPSPFFLISQQQQRTSPQASRFSRLISSCASPVLPGLHPSVGSCSSLCLLLGKSHHFLHWDSGAWIMLQFALAQKAVHVYNKQGCNMKSTGICSFHPFHTVFAP